MSCDHHECEWGCFSMVVLFSILIGIASVVEDIRKDVSEIKKEVHAIYEKIPQKEEVKK